MILITGATGTAGRATLEAAQAMGQPIRAMVRSTADAAAVPGVETVVADYADAASLARALAGVSVAFVVCGPIPDLVALESGMIAACRAAGVGHIVLNSALGAGHWPKSFPSWHIQVEAILKESGLGWTILRPNGFMQNIVTYNAASIRANQAFFAAMGEAKTSLIDVRDVGAVAATVLGAPGRHAGQTYELNGPEAVSNGDIAARISRITGTPVSFVDIPEEAQRQAMLDLGMPAWQVAAILELQEYYRTGACASVDATVETLVGRPARRLDAYLVENAAAFRAEAV